MHHILVDLVGSRPGYYAATFVQLLSSRFDRLGFTDWRSSYNPDHYYYFSTRDEYIVLTIVKSMDVKARLKTPNYLTEVFTYPAWRSLGWKLKLGEKRPTSVVARSLSLIIKIS